MRSDRDRDQPMEFPMQISPTSTKTEFSEIVSNLFHGAIALAFGLTTLAAAAHVMARLV